MSRGTVVFVMTLNCALLGPTVTTTAPATAQATCAPTPADAEGPFYKPNAPQRTSTGRGLVVMGTVLSAGSCAPVPGPRIEWWQANAGGQYDDAHRAVMTLGPDGRYRFETDFPAGYYGRPPHIHFKAFAPGHRSLTTQLYLKRGQTEAPFDLVLVRE